MLAVFARQDGIRLRAGGDDDCSCRQLDVVVVAPLALGIATLAAEGDRAHRRIRIDVDASRRQALCKAQAFFKRPVQFFVIERIGRTVDQPAPISNRHAAP